MTKIPSKPKNDQNTPQNLEKDQNIPKTPKMTKISSKPKNDQNTHGISKMTKIPLIFLKSPNMLKNH